MVEEKDISLILYEDWQYLCCGEPFEVGDFICWSVTPFINVKDDKIKLDYLYDGCPGGIGDIVGKVKKIILLGNMDNEQCECFKEYNSVEELNKNALHGYKMLITLEKTTYKEYNDNYYSSKSNPAAIIIGDIKNLGLEIAKVLRKNNINIVISDSNKDDLIHAKKELKKIKSFSNVEYYNCNITNTKDISELIKHSEICFSNIKIWINNTDIKMSKEILKKLVTNHTDGTVYDIIISEDDSKIIVTDITPNLKNITFEQILNMSDVEMSKKTEKVYSISNTSSKYISEFLFQLFNNNTK